MTPDQIHASAAHLVWFFASSVWGLMAMSVNVKKDKLGLAFTWALIAMISIVITVFEAIPLLTEFRRP